MTTSAPQQVDNKDQGNVWRQFLVTIGQLATLAAVLLPIVGLTARWLAFSFDERLAPSRDLALAASPWELAALGAEVVAKTSLALWPFILAAAIMAIRRPPHYASTRRRRLETLISGIVMFILIAGTVAPVAIAPIVLLSMIVYGSLLEVWHQRSRPFTFGVTWPALIFYLASGVGIISVGGGVHLTKAEFTFDSNTSSASHNGTYLVVGEKGSFTYLISCADTASNVELVRTDQINEVKIIGPVKQHPATGLQWVIGHKAVSAGTKTRC